MNAPKTGRKRKRVKDPALEKYGKRFIQIRRELGYTSAETFANEKGLERVQYARMEAAENFTAKTFEKYLKAAGITHEHFFSEGFD